jgi:Glycosyl transferase family 2
MTAWIESSLLRRASASASPLTRALSDGLLLRETGNRGTDPRSAVAQDTILIDRWVPVLVITPAPFCRSISPAFDDAVRRRTICGCRVSLPANSPAILGRERELASSATSPGMPSKAGPELTIVVPTLNERDNVGPLIDRLDRLLVGVDWEAVFVDDDSADDTAEHLRDRGRTDRRIRCIRRFGRRGLSSACIEGILSTSARYIAVIDGDLQHDETLPPRMLDTLKREQTDLVVASRYLAPGAADGLSTRRRVLSRAGVRLARVLLKSDITDPVSGFFMMRSEVADKAAARLSGVGTKILIDLLASAPGPLSVTELPYRFRGRNSGAANSIGSLYSNTWHCSPRR